MNILKQSTGLNLVFGPFLDSTDGVTPETALSIVQADVRLSKNAGAFAQKNGSAAGTHLENGFYSINLNTADTGSIGRLVVAVNKTGALPVWREYRVVPANVFDALAAGSDLLDVNTSQIGGTAQTANDVGADVDTILARIIGTLAAGTHNPQSGDSFARIGSNGAGLTALATAAALTTVEGKIDTIDGIVDAILVDTGTTLDAKLDAIDTVVDAILVDTGTTLDTKINTIDSIVDAIKAKTDSLTFTVAGKADANVTHVNEIEVDGAGTSGDPWGPV